MARKPKASQNSSRYWLHEVNANFAKNVTPNMIVLDAGAGDQPYRHLFDHAQYESADFEAVNKTYAKSTYVCDLVQIPVDDARFDRVLLNQVLEHLPEPTLVLTELHRVLKPDGLILCTCPLFYEEHEQPYDFYRYTQYGLRFLFNKTGFEVLELDWLEGYFGTVAYQFNTMARCLPPQRPAALSGPKGWLYWQIIKLLRAQAKPMSKMFYAMDRNERQTDNGFPKNYVILARKVPTANVSSQ